MALVSYNPATEEEIARFEEHTDEEIQGRIANAESAFREWRSTSFAHRAERMRDAANILRDEKDRLGLLITCEMGKVLSASIAEVEKSALVCEYYADNAEQMLAEEIVVTDASKSYVRFDPIGIVFAVMPWNFPFWQVFRFAAPALMAGNCGLLKHASSVTKCSLAIEDVLTRAGFPHGVFQSLLVSGRRVAPLIDDPRIRAVTLTGSENAGRSIGAAAGKALKTSVLELGGSDPFIVLADADLANAADIAAKARFQNCGQSCIAAKRFIVERSVLEEFTRLFVENVQSLRVGDPSHDGIDVGPLASVQMVEDIERQVRESVDRGAIIRTGGCRMERPGFFYEPTILSDIVPGMPAYHEELFGPVASVIAADSLDDAIRIANDTSFGLGSSIWTQDGARAEKYARDINAGCVFINGMVKSDPRLPFGGVKDSGYGRELSHYGLKEFVNVKTIWIA